MKPLKILLLTSAQSFVLVACHQPMDEQLMPNINIQELGKDITGEFMLSVDYELKPRRAGLGSVVMNMTGDGKINQYGTYSLYLEHKLIHVDLSQQTLPSNGKFSMHNNEGSIIHGIYEPFVVDGNNHKEVKGRIMGGSGIFEGIYGGIKIELQPQSETKFVAIVYGKLRFKRQQSQPEVSLNHLVQVPTLK